MTQSSKGIRRWSVVGALVVAVGTSVAVAAPAATAAPYCGIYWGSLAKTAKITETAQMVNVRAGRHECFDRLVVDVRAGGADGYFVRYVDTVRRDGSGFAVPLRGGARLEVTVVAPAYDDNYRLTYRPANPSELVTGGRCARAPLWLRGPRAPSPAVCSGLPLPRRHTSAVAPVAFSAVVRTVMCQPPDSSAPSDASGQQEWRRAGRADGCLSCPWVIGHPEQPL
jgi:hypothetical protein